MLTPPPNACWLWFLGLLLTAVVLKDKMKREAYLTTVNWHGQQRPHVGSWSISWALGSGLVLGCLPQKM